MKRGADLDNDGGDEFFESQQGGRNPKRDPGKAPVVPPVVHLADMPNDQDENYWTYDMGIIKARMMPFDVEVAGGWLRFNPFVFFISLIIIWSFIIYCNDRPPAAKEDMGEWKTWISDNFTWLYIGSVGAFFIFDCYLMFSRFGGVVLGKPGEAPRFSTASWFAMLFSAGIGIGLFYFGVSEPIYHYSHNNRWIILPRYERAMAAMNVSWFHWGLAPSACYSIVGLPIAFYAHREGMPCSMRTVFYPLMGKAIHGIIGDLIDISAVMGTIFGIGTSLGLGVDTINKGLNRIFDDFKYDIDNQKWIIWVITAFATVSVATGLDYGIRRLSEGNFLLGLFVLGVMAMAGDTFYILDLFIETAGLHIWSLTDLEFHTDAFADNVRIVNGAANKSNFMDYWTIFYWGWWISWAPFVGVFIAQISKGRTVREFILGNVFVPSLLTSLWFTIYGGLGMEMEMQAETLGIGGNYHVMFPETKANDYTNYDPTRTAYAGNMPKCGLKTYDGTKFEMVDGKKITRLSCVGQDALWEVIEAYSFGMEKFMSFITIVAVITYFVTSSDSGSMVVDMMCSNGIQEPPLLQRIFWGIVEGTVAFSLLEAGGEDALKALQTASIAAGLPFCIIMIGMMVATYQMFVDMEIENPRFLEEQAEMIARKSAQKEKPRRFKRRILEYVNNTVMSILCLCRGEQPGPLKTAIAIAAPSYVDSQTMKDFDFSKEVTMEDGSKKVVQTYSPTIQVVLSAAFFFMWILFHIVDVAEEGFWTFGWMCYFAFVTITSLNRGAVREKLNLRGNALCDCCIVFWFYPCAVMQMAQEAEELLTEAPTKKSQKGSEMP